MHLILDIGNTKVKYHLFDQEESVLSATVESIQEAAVQIIEDFPALTHVIYADVRGMITKEKLQAIFPQQQVQEVKELRFPFTSQYATPETLGDDRIALVAAATKLYPLQNCLIVDAGSCLTFDFITAEGNYLGGAISPGLYMRFKSLQHFTGKLPLVNPEESLSLYGDSTATSINAGVIHGIIHEIEGQINAYQREYPSLTVILTGGDALLLSKSVKNTIFAHPNFLADGLNYLLDYNKN
ncbi:MAG: type III pantothenate kinase [Flavobacteriaceae bacterium]|nr:type III pantothenate kinase [Flavobacteriaceae bacterium]